MSNLFEGTIQWPDEDLPTSGLLFSDGDIEDNDDDIFFYVNSEQNLKDMLNEEGVDFKLLSYHKLNNQ